MIRIAAQNPKTISTSPSKCHRPECLGDVLAKPIFGEGKRLVLYCASAWRSALATETLQRMGVPGVCHLEGGFTAWKAAELPISTRPHKP